MGLFGAALLYGDGIITPAISVTERPRRAQCRDRCVQAAIVFMAVAILFALFAVGPEPRHGADRQGVLICLAAILQRLLPYSAVMYLNTLCSRVELCKTAHFPACG